MANIKEQLSAPESGWKRYDNTDNNIVYNGTGWEQPPGDIGIHYNNSCFLTQTPGENYVLYVYTSRIRIISDYHYNMGIFTIDIDGNYTCNVDCYQTGEKYQHLMFEKNDLEKTVHKITVTLQEKVHPGRNMLVLDAIDIDEDGYLIEPRTFGERYTTFDENVWQRIDDTNEYIQYIGSDWSNYNTSVTGWGMYNNTRHATKNINDYLTFKIYNTEKIRIYGEIYKDNNQEKNHDIYIDNKLVNSFSTYSSSISQSESGQRLIYENLNLDKNEHTIKIQNNADGWLLLDCFEIDKDGIILAPDRNIGDLLTKPDPTWKRIDDRDVNFYYIGTDWVKYDSELSYNNGNHYYYVTDENKDNTYLEFYVYTNKLRIIGTYYFAKYRSENNEIIIDNIPYTFSEVGNYKTKLLVFEKLDLNKKIHHVIIKCNEVTKQIVLDAIDIDEDGYLLTEEEYNQYLREHRKNDISINKTLKANLPESTTKGIEIHFTEDGEIYINKKDGTFMKVNSSAEQSYTDEEVNTEIDNIINNF